MAWVRLDDQWFHHRKVMGLSTNAKVLYLAGLCHCNDQLTDGLISIAAARSLAGLLGVPHKTASELVAAGMWHKTGEGFEVHDYLDYQPPAAQVRKEREQSAERMRKMRSKRSPKSTETVENPEGDGAGYAVTTTATPPEHPPNFARSSPSPTPKPSDLHTVVTSPESQLPADDDGILNHAARLVASDALERRTAEKGSVGSPDAWLAKATASALEKHRTVWARMLQKNPATTPQQLAAAVAAPPKPPDPLEQTAAAQRAAAQRTARRLRGEACPACEDSGVILADDNQAHPCDTCRRTA